MDSSETKGQVTKGKLFLDSPDLLLPDETTFFMLGIYRTSYDHLKVWSKMDKYDLSGIATKN